MLSLYIFLILIGLTYYVAISNETRQIHQNESFVNRIENNNQIHQQIIDEAEQDIQYTQDPEELIHHHMKLWKLYYDGVPDKYDFHGNRIEGTSPNPELALYHINEAINLGYEEAYITLAKMYHFGFHNFDENKEEAKQIYAYIIDKGLPNRQEALKHFQDIVEEERYSNMSNWLNIPANNIKNTLRERNQFSVVDRDEHMRNVKRIKEKQRKYRNNNYDNHITVTYNNRFDNPIFRDVQLTNRNKQRISSNVRSDSQNVHDSALIRTVRGSIENLKGTTDITMDDSEVLRDIRMHILKKPKCDKRNNAIRALDAMEQTHKPLVAFQMKETDLLNLVWNRINNNHDENSENLKDNLYEQLANSVEHDKVVCTTGRFTRVLDSLNVVDKDVVIKPRSLINRELMDKSAMIRKEMYNERSDSDKNMIDSIQENDVQMKFTEDLKRNIRRQFQQDYVDTKLLTQDELDSEINKWIDYI